MLADMKIIQRLFVLSVIFAFGTVSIADTFTNQLTKESFHGYVIGPVKDGEIAVYTREKGTKTLKAAEWQIELNQIGRNKKVVVFTIDKEIDLEIKTKTFEEELDDLL